MYLSETADDNEAASLLRPATVCAPGELAAHEGEVDVFVCDHLYHRGCQVRLCCGFHLWLPDMRCKEGCVYVSYHVLSLLLKGAPRSSACISNRHQT